MKYLMLVCTDPDYTPGQDDGAPDVNDWVTEMDGKGIRLMGNATRPASDATTVRVRNREVLLTDGPYAETKEQLGGIQVLEARDLNHAIQLISQSPGVKLNCGTIEIRPAADIKELMRESERRRRKHTSR